MVRTPLFQGGDTGSSPVGVTVKERLWNAEALLFFCFVVLSGGAWRRMEKHHWQKFPLLLGLFSLLAFPRCQAVPTCDNVEAPGNWLELNSTANDLAPLPYQDNSLLLLSDRPVVVATDTNVTVLKGGKARFLVSTHYRDGWSVPEFLQLPPLNTFSAAAGASYWVDAANGRTEIFFAAAVDEGNFDLFVITGQEGEWEEPRPLTALNTPGWEAYPAIAPDGSFLVFCSDRPSGKGGVDLYIAFRLGEDMWSIPQPLTELNSVWDEISPVIDQDFTLYFATQAMSAQRTFDIVRAPAVQPGQWGRIELLPYPINTSSDEMTPQLWGDSLLLSSNRPGGCGGFDLYRFPLCPPVQVAGTVQSDPAFHSREHIVAFGAQGQVYAEAAVRHDGSFSMKLPPRQQYRLVYRNPCYAGDTIAAVVKAPCTLQPTVVRVDFEIPPIEQPALPFPLTVDVPYFVEGYYKPTTRANLQDLRLLLDMKLLAGSGAGIAYPDSVYDLYAAVVEQQFQVFREQLLEALQALTDPCIGDHQDLFVVVEGYASPEEIAPNARYAGAEIWDEDFEMFVTAGMPITPSLLARLRAYFVFRYLQEQLRQRPQWQRLLPRIHWQLAASVAAHNSPEQRKVRILLTNTPPLRKL